MTGIPEGAHVISEVSHAISCDTPQHSATSRGIPRAAIAIGYPALRLPLGP